MTDSSSNQSGHDHPEPSGENPYAPPVLRSATVDDALNRVQANDTQSVPDSSFWTLSAFGLFVLITPMVATGGMATPIILPFLVSFLMGIIRVCMIYSRRALARLAPLPHAPLLVTSTFVSFGILIACTTAFGAMCTTGLLVMEPMGAQLGIIIVLASGGVSLAILVFLFLCSISLALV